ncbi:SPX domain containing protein [Nitzschia inconspicua]|uniref:SPX domain containing protein n=1 Tax=Nitzschia inconspicua TaxID=303405 RepID=A0A9K3PQK4_9STRA|nr:SPX domain containing protein [Nitzschia inconspicua]
MKFCKNLQRVVDISDPEWAPFWTNYKMLKKLIKELPSLVPSDEGKNQTSHVATNGTRQSLESSPSTSGSPGSNTAAAGHPTGEEEAASSGKSSRAVTRSVSATSVMASGHDATTIGKSPGEVAFFKLLHSEFKKASHFFDRATEEFTIRESRVREGMEIMRQPNSIMVNEKWSFLAKSIYRLYKDLLLLETFAIMTYCSFSKILKKHDKVTGYETRNAFMENIVNKANFTHYPQVLAMITRCEGLYEEVSTNLLQEGKHGLYEDERLFINMISRLNEQVLGSSDNDVHTERTKEAAQRRTNTNNDQLPALSENESPATSSLRNLVEENAKSSPVQVASEGKNNMDGDDDSSAEGNSVSAESHRKRPAPPNSSVKMGSPIAKRTRPSVL